MRCSVQTRPQLLILSLDSSAATPKRQLAEFTLLCSTPPRLNYPWATQRLTASYSIFPPARSLSHSGLNTVGSGGETIPTRLTQRLTPLAPRILKPQR